MTLEHPHLYVTAGSYIGLLSLDELRRSVMKGPGHKLWCALQDDVNRQAALPPYDPSTPLPNRSAAEIKRRENDCRLSEAALQRVTDAALSYLIGESRVACVVLPGNTSFKKIRQYARVKINSL